MIDRVDLNADLGESWGAYTLGDDAAMLDIVTTANLACGFHGGDPDVIAQSVATARDKGVAIGAHPGFMDLWGFGRREMRGDGPESVRNMIQYQIAALAGMARIGRHPATHVKTHGSLGNMAAVDPGLADTVAAAVKATDPDLILVVMPGNALDRAARGHGLRIANEIYADRTYDDEGNLTPRRAPGAVLHDPAEATARVLQMLEDGAIRSTGGRRLPVRIDTVCVHGDSPGAVAMARAIRQGVETAGLRLAPFSTFVD
ncbi:MAG: 5-oxoprolinase subunit PxpA [Pseudomonadota bacterium]